MDKNNEETEEKIAALESKIDELDNENSAL